METEVVEKLNINTARVNFLGDNKLIKNHLHGFKIVKVEGSFYAANEFTKENFDHFLINGTKIKKEEQGELVNLLWYMYFKTHRKIWEHIKSNKTNNAFFEYIKYIGMAKFALSVKRIRDKIYKSQDKY